ncbi:hypothetical protein WMY93_014343 [Mugilogobius chulae]|uniref:G-protein coupled receptors family 1 profile domain-containing protein n=1 Tax=Mugilogobius chulae TaxID=88201 RepID=A0AAW0NVA9_9GOBI
MRYEVNMTVNIVIVAMLLIWFKSLLLAMVTLFGWPAYGSHSSISAAHCTLHASHSSLRKVFAVLFSVACFIIPSLVIFAVYCAVYKVARSAALQQAPVVATSQAKNRSDSINSQTTMITTTRTVPQRLSPERAFSGGKAALTLVFIVGQFLICWLPYFIFHLQMALSGPCKAGRFRRSGELAGFLIFCGEPVFLRTSEQADQRRAGEVQEVLLEPNVGDRDVQPRRVAAGELSAVHSEDHRGSSSSSGSSVNSGRRSSLRASVEREQKIPGQVPEEAS